MAKTQLSMAHINALEAFKITVIDAVPAKEGTIGVAVNIESGRKFDRIMVRYVLSDKTETQPEVWFFVDRKDGTIYGRKSDISPNLRWYYGTIFTTDQWEWSGNFASPKHPEQFDKLDKYGTLERYVPRTQIVVPA